MAGAREGASARGLGEGAGLGGGRGVGRRAGPGAGRGAGAGASTRAPGCHRALRRGTLRRDGGALLGPQRPGGGYWGASAGWGCGRWRPAALGSASAPAAPPGSYQERIKLAAREPAFWGPLAPGRSRVGHPLPHGGGGCDFHLGRISWFLGGQLNVSGEWAWGPGRPQLPRWGPRARRAAAPHAPPSALRHRSPASDAATPPPPAGPAPTPRSWLALPAPPPRV